MVRKKSFRCITILFIALFCLPFLCPLFCGEETKFGEVLSQSDSIAKGVSVEKVVLYCQKRPHSNQKIMRYGVLMKKPDAKATVLICHGFTCNKNDIGFLRYLFPEYNCMTFDFRAHGENPEGQFCTLGKNEAYDVIAAARFLKKHPDLQGKPLLAYGFSMGAVAAIEAQAKDQGLFDAMILDCPFDSTENVLKNGLNNKKISLFGYEFNIPGKSILRKYAFHPYVQSFVKAVLQLIAGIGAKNIRTFISPIYPAESVKKVSVPCLFIHCKNDEKISVDGIKTVYYNASSSYKKLWITNGRRHFDSFFYNPEKYAEKVRKFLAKVVNKEVFSKNKHRIVEEGYDDDLLGTALNLGSVKKEKKYERE